jgi:heat shock protein HslJ
MLLAVAACGSDDSSSSSSSLAGHTYLSTSVTGQTLVEGTRITLVFASDTVAAVAGCNTMTGGYSVDGDTLKVATMAQTQMACSDDLMAQDQWIAAFLQAGPKMVADADKLTLSGGSTTIEFGERSKVSTSSSIDGGAWTIVSLDSGGTTTKAPAGAYLSVDGDELYVATGCNTGFGTVTIDDGTVTIGTMGSTLRACDESLTAWESALNGFLTGELDYTVSGDDLTLSSSEGTLTLKLVPNS